MCYSLAVVVEDASSSCCVTVKVMPHMTVSSLKQQVRCVIWKTAPTLGAALEHNSQELKLS